MIKLATIFVALLMLSLVIGTIGCAEERVPTLIPTPSGNYSLTLGGATGSLTPTPSDTLPPVPTTTVRQTPIWTPEVGYVSCSELAKFLPEPPTGWQLEGIHIWSCPDSTGKWGDVLFDDSTNKLIYAASARYRSQNPSEVGVKEVSVFIRDYGSFYADTDSMDWWDNQTYVDGYPAIRDWTGGLWQSVGIEHRFHVSINCEYDKAVLNQFSDLIDYDGIAALR